MLHRHPINTRLAARAGTRQVDVELHTDACADAVDRAVNGVWLELLAALRTATAWDVQARVLPVLRTLPGAIHAALSARLVKVAQWGYRSTAANLTRTLPVGYLAAAVVQRRAMRESRLLEDEGSPTDQPGALALILRAAGLDPVDYLEPFRQPGATQQRELFAALLFQPPPLDTVQRYVHSLLTGVGFTGEGQRFPPERLAGIVASEYAQGKSQREIAKALLPAVDNVRTSARRVARTWGLHVAHEVQMQAHEQLGDLVIGYQVHATFGPHTRSWHAHRSGTIYYLHPHPGEPGPDQQPHPPMEAKDPSVRPPKTPQLAWNCMCYLSPVLRPPDWANDPAAKALLASAPAGPAHEVYTDWWDQADARRRRIAVGAKRYAAAQDAAGAEPSWQHFVEPTTGRLLTARQLAAETPAARAQRLAKVQAEVEQRRRLARAVSAHGFLPPVQAPAPRELTPVPNVEVRIDKWRNPGEVQQAADRIIHGGKATAEPAHLHAAVGAQPGAVLHVGGSADSLTINTVHPEYTASRMFRRVRGKLVVDNVDISVKHKGQGLGAKVFADQVAGLIRLGADRIQASAAGEKGDRFNGYYTWPRLGYDAKLPTGIRRQLPDDLAGAKTLLDLYSLPGGSAWWKENGGGIAVTFDLKPGSRSRQVLAAYLREKGQAVPPELAEARGGSASAGVEEPDLSPADEAALDRVWARIVAGATVSAS